MLKIGILTFHTSVNYGAFMQAYSLSTRLNSYEDIDAEIINYEMPKVINYYKKYIFNPIRMIRSPLMTFKLLKRTKVFKQHRPSLSLSHYYVLSDNRNDLYAEIKGKYNIVVVGSDAVWNWGVRGFPNAYFIDDDIGAKKNELCGICTRHELFEYDGCTKNLSKQSFK